MWDRFIGNLWSASLHDVLVRTPSWPRNPGRVIDAKFTKLLNFSFGLLDEQVLVEIWRRQADVTVTHLPRVLNHIILKEQYIQGSALRARVALVFPQYFLCMLLKNMHLWRKSMFTDMMQIVLSITECVFLCKRMCVAMNPIDNCNGTSVQQQRRMYLRQNPRVQHDCWGPGMEGTCAELGLSH